MSSKYKHLQMVCPHCGATCNVALSATWTGDVFLHWNAETNEAEYDLADSTLDYECCDLLCDACGSALFDTWEEMENYFRKERKNG